jgi:ribosome-associated protein
VPLTTPGTARLAARTALAKKARDLVVLDVQGLSGIGDYFLICCGASTTHVQTIADAIELSLKSEGQRVLHREGRPDSGWVLLDYGDVIVHVFLPETRAFYALERLWGDAPELLLDAEGG